MNDLLTRAGTKVLLIPGGWVALVPEVQPDPTSLRAFERYLVEDGHGEWKAQQLALESVQKCFEAGYVRGLRHMLYQRAKEYAQRFPHLVREDGTLAGFDPAKLQGAYFPHDHPGRRGKAFVDSLMGQMAREAEHAAEAS